MSEEMKRVEDERALFETWARTDEGNCAEYDLIQYSTGSHRRVVDGDTYMNEAVERDWMVWQARAALSQSAASVPVDERPIDTLRRNNPEFVAHLERTSTIVETWPAWKQSINAPTPTSATVTQPAKHPLGKRRWSKEAEMIEGWLNAAAAPSATQPADRAPAADAGGLPPYEVVAALNSLRWMLNKSDECDKPNMRATTLLDKHHSKDGKTIRQDLEILWRHFNPNRPEMTALLLSGGDRTAAKGADGQDDTTRMDWLESNQATLSRLYNNTGYILAVDGKAVRVDKSARAAIDFAITRAVAKGAV